MSVETEELIKTVKENTDNAVKEALKPILADNAELKAKLEKVTEGSVTLGLKVDAADKATAEAKVDAACKKLLCNQIMESYTFDLVEA